MRFIHIVQELRPKVGVSYEYFNRMDNLTSSRGRILLLNITLLQENDTQFLAHAPSLCQVWFKSIQ